MMATPPALSSLAMERPSLLSLTSTVLHLKPFHLIKERYVTSYMYTFKLEMGKVFNMALAQYDLGVVRIPPCEYPG